MVIKQDFFSKHANGMIAFLVIVAITLGQFSLALYTPAMPIITQKLQASTYTIKMTLTVYMFGFGVSQLLYGPLSDRYGRRPILLLGITIYVLASLICATALHPWALLIGRMLQGLGVGSANAIGYAIFRDLFSGAMLAKWLSYMSSCSATAAMTAPLAGGYIIKFLPWQANFLFLAGYSGLILLGTWKFLVETNPAKNPQALQPRFFLQNYAAILENKQFVGASLCASLLFAVILVSNALLPFLFINIFGLSSVLFGWLSFIQAGGYLVGAITGGQLAAKIHVSHVIRLGILLLILFAALLLGTGIAGYLHVWTVLILVTLIFFGIGFAFPSCSAKVMEPFPNNAGSAAALLGCTLALTSALATTFAAKIQETSQIPFAATVLIIGLLALSIFFFFNHKKLS